MDPGNAEAGLKAIRDRLSRILTGSSLGVIEEALAQVRPAAELWRKCGLRQWHKRGSAWGYQISRERPLEFQVCQPRGYKTMVDLSCALRWPKDPAGEPTEQNFTLRVWSLEKRIFFRPDWDSEQLEGTLEGLGKRVMLRLHFDLANAGQEGPKYHIQIGGIQGQGECCWFHPSINLPRIAHPPSDIVLICEMIASNFFPDQYRMIRTDAIWRSVVRDIQRCVLQEYFRQCHQVVLGDQHYQSLLDWLSNIVWQ